MIKKNLKQENGQDTKLLTSNICTDDGTLLTDLITLFNNFKFIPQVNTTVNIDDITESGIIQVMDVSSGTLPIDISRESHNFFLITLVRIEDNPYRRQILLDIRTTNIYTRHRGASGWLPWTSLNNNYYTNEQITGVWINGKPIYKKVIYIASLPNNNAIEYPHGISNIDEIVNASAFRRIGNIWQPLVWLNPGASSTIIYDSISYEVTRNSVNVLSQKTDNSNNSAYIILEYTKTTD